MLGISIIQVFPFVIFFIMWVTLFTVCYQTLKVEISSAEEDYPNVFTFMQYFLMTYRNSIGDISAPGYSNWMEKSSDVTSELIEKHAAISFIWLVWLANQFVNLIILLNFLIAVISQVYDNVVAMQKQVLYAQKVELNREIYMLQKFFGNLKQFKFIIFSMDIKQLEQEDDEWVGFVQTLKKFISKKLNAQE